MSIVWSEITVELSQLKPYERNPRKISKKAFENLKKSLAEDGYHQRVLITHDNRVIGGHQRLKALQEMGNITISALQANTEISDEEYKRILLRDNLSYGDFEASILCQDYTKEELIELGGQKLLQESGIKSFFKISENSDAVVTLPTEPHSQLGDQWILGDHTIRCGSSTNAQDVQKLLDGTTPPLMVTDPPYGVNYDPEWRMIVNAGDQIRDGKVEGDDNANWEQAWRLFPGHVAYVWHAGLFGSTVQQSLEKSGFKINSQIIWVKNNMIFSRGHYHWKHEPCFYATRKNGKSGWNGDRTETTVWEIDTILGNFESKNDAHTKHSTQKPVACMQRPIENNSVKGDAIYEPFSGSGTTIIACEITERRCYAMELMPAYVDMAVIRWQNFTGKKAFHAETGRIFGE